MITVFSGTNRKNSRTRLVAEYIYGLLVEQAEEEVQFFSLEDLPNDMISVDMYSPEGQSKALAAIQDEYMIPTTKFYFVVPEYNGGIPGIFKLFLDACSIRDYAGNFKGGKKAALTGVASGRSGAARGMEYMTGFLNYLTIQVLPNKLPVSQIEALLENNELTNEQAKKAIQAQVSQFLEF
jgi:NAD(P)H-dependent FMN reductase